MKAGVAFSSVAHAAILGFAMVSVGAPKPLPTPDVEALPIELVTISEITRNVQGDRDASAEEPPAPAPTQRQVSTPEARTVGDQTRDTDIQAERESPAPPTEKTEAPTPTPAPEPAERPEPVSAPEPTPSEPAPPQPKQAEPTPAPEPEKDIAMLVEENQPPQPSETEADPDVLKLPDVVAAPKPRPPRPAPQAEAKPAKKTDATEKATVNKTETTGGGAKASTQKKAGLGTKRGSTGGTLSQSEKDAVRGRLEGCWSVADLTGHPDAATMKARVDFKLNRDGTLDGRVRVRASGTDRSTRAIFSVRVRSAIEACAPYKLPADKYDNWKEFTVNFSLADML
ncbi:MAG: hypothetical protein AAF764_03760 [Pseudomonadota bacterium]